MTVYIGNAKKLVDSLATLREIKADLYGADLRWANLRWADLRSANLYSADLRGADLTGAKHNSHTRWPTDFDALSALGGAS